LRDDPDEPEMIVTHATRDLMSGHHPTTQASDFTVVVDQNDKIVSSLCIIPQTWTYDGIPFTVGRPELVATKPAYRRRGLMAAQFEAIHAKSADRGEMVQAITGIPWLYRRVGYEMGLDLDGHRDFLWARQGNDKAIAPKRYRWRAATQDDIPILHELYAIHCQESLIARVRTDAMWLFELFVAHREGFVFRHVQMVETGAGEVVGYVAYYVKGGRFVVTETAVSPNHSLREISLFMTRQFKAEADTLNATREKPIEGIRFELGAAHPLYRALDSELGKQKRPYSWFIRVADLPAFLQHIAPVLEKRLQNSVSAGFSGNLRLSFYRSHLSITFENGKLSDVAAYEPRRFFDCDAFFPDLTFLHLVFGHHTLEEVGSTRSDCYAMKGETAVLLNILFPKQHSWVSGLE
jgi:predicted acetyltransferase